MTGTSYHVDMQVADFLAFLEHRPAGERWELVGGMPIMMAPPKIAHQRIASNIERALNNALEALGLQRRADREIGLQIEEVPGYRPEPEVAIIDADYENDRYAARFYGVVEVLSATDTAANPRSGRTAIDDKLAFYRSHAFAEFILVVSQNVMIVEMHLRDDNGIWLAPARSTEPSQTIRIPTLGSVCSLAEVYRGVRLAAIDD